MSKTKTHPLNNSHEPLTPDASSEGEPSQIAPPVVINEEDHQNNTGADLKRKQTKEIAPDTPRRSKRQLPKIINHLMIGRMIPIWLDGMTKT